MHYNAYFHKFKHNSKKVWKGINDLLSKSKRNDHYQTFNLYENGEYLSDPFQISNKFNTFFTNIGPQRYGAHFSKYLPPPVTHSCFLTPTTPEEVNTELKNLSESIASDVPVKIIKIASHRLAALLSHIYNNSIGTGEYPTKLKFFIVTPIHKADSKLQVTNYRPISLLPVFSKIFERLVHRRLLNFLMQNNIFNHQFGFQPSKTTNMAILEIYTKIVNALENKDIACSVYLDVAKAFDTVNHNILITKLRIMASEV